ncbi:SAM-dependent methyltransferase [bacterium]|nr:SAM-dependent methyltransferase [bacterium]
MEIVLKPIGKVISGREKNEDDFWGKEISVIELESSEFTEESLKGLENFSHVEVIFYFDKVKDEKIEKAARHPRNNQNFPKIGIFAQRGKNRPNKLGLTTCKILGISGLKLKVSGLDAIVGTPVLDLKPLMKNFLPKGEVTEPFWVSEAMKNYW